MRSPNILFMTSHDTGDWLSCYGHRTVRSPHLDALAAQGCRFSDAFCTSPVCTPSRGAMMTGRYPQSNGLMGLIQTPYRWRLRPGQRHLSHLLSGHGYHTVLFNHQHEAPCDDPLGFHEHRARGGPESYRLRTGERIATAEQTAEDVAEFLARRGPEEPPFYAQVGFFETHTPYGWNGAPPDDGRGVAVPPYVTDNADARRHVAGLQGAIRSLDRAVGRILGALSEAGLDGDTIVVFTTDHGVELPHCKWELYDGGIHTALLMRWPGGGVSGGAVCGHLVSHVDLVPTILELIDRPVPQDIEGRSFAEFLRDSTAPPARDAIFAMMHRHDRWVESRCVRTRHYKLIRNYSPSRMPDGAVSVGGVSTLAWSAARERPVVELYDLLADPYEMSNIAGTPGHRQVRDDLDARLANWLRAVEDPLLHGPVACPYYQMAAENLGRPRTGASARQGPGA